ncbi:MAG: hypothetical protein ABIP48_28680 [Planctomycetota bacterium]
MKRIAWIATSLAVTLLFASCRPTGPEPPAPAPPAGPPPEAVAPQEPPTAPPAPAGETDEPGQPEGDAKMSESTAGESKKGGVLGAIGRAVQKSVVGDTEKELGEARPFAP